MCCHSTIRCGVGLPNFDATLEFLGMSISGLAGGMTFGVSSELPLSPPAEPRKFV